MSLAGDESAHRNQSFFDLRICVYYRSELVNLHLMMVCLIISGIIKLFRFFLLVVLLALWLPFLPLLPYYSLGVRGGPLSAFHLGLPQPYLYLKIPFILQHQVDFCLLLDHLVQNLFDIVI